jgi:hypothetical protein
MFDTWTNQRQPFVDVMIVCNGTPFFLFTEKILASSEVILRKSVDRAFCLVQGCGAVLVAVCADNASGAVNVIEAFTAKYPAVIGLRCQSHSLQLAETRRPPRVVKNYCRFDDTNFIGILSGLQ